MGGSNSNEKEEQAAKAVGKLAGFKQFVADYMKPSPKK